MTTAPPLTAAQRGARTPGPGDRRDNTGLAGYVGVDLILTPSVQIVVEVNPRLTTAYVGLTEVLDINVAAASLGVFDQVLAPAPGAIGTGRKTVEVSTAYHPVTIPHP